MSPNTTEMHRTPCTEPIDTETFVDVFHRLDLDRFERYLADGLRWMNPPAPTITGRALTMRILRIWTRLMPGFAIAPIRHERTGNTIVIDRTDIVPVTRSFVLEFRVLGTFAIVDDKVVAWEDKLSLRNGVSAIVQAFLQWPARSRSRSV